jgi:hypothetical protein
MLVLLGAHAVPTMNSTLNFSPTLTLTSISHLDLVVPPESRSVRTTLPVTTKTRLAPRSALHESRRESRKRVQKRVQKKLQSKEAARLETFATNLKNRFLNLPGGKYPSHVRSKPYNLTPSPQSSATSYTSSAKKTTRLP